MGPTNCRLWSLVYSKVNVLFGGRGRGGGGVERGGGSGGGVGLGSRDASPECGDVRVPGMLTT